jgi:hypothetical protein
MNTHRLTLGITILAFFATSASVFAFTGCSGDDTNSAPSTERDSGKDSTTPDSGKIDKDGGKDKDSTAESDAEDGGDAEDAETADAEDASEDVSLDTGKCTSDASTCNSCYDDAQAAADPYNACSPFTKNCVKFSASRVPAGAVGKL